MERFPPEARKPERKRVAAHDVSIVARRSRPFFVGLTLMTLMTLLTLDWQVSP